MTAQLLEPLSYEYMRHALLTAVCLGTVGAILSVFLLLKGWSLVGDSLSHAAIPGVAIAYIFGIPYVIGALGSGLLAAGCITYLNRQPELKRDAIIALVYTSFLALGLLIISVHPIPVSLNAIIYGNILAIPNADLVQTLIITSITFLYLTLKWRDISLILYDAYQARLSHTHPNIHQLLLVLLLSLTVIIGIQSIGIILITALLIIPGAAARLICRRMGTTLITAAVIGGSTAAAGTLISYYTDNITTAAIVSLQSAIFFLILILQQLRRHV